MYYSSRYGFTLVELSIVLVIIGLLVGGVLAGQSLIHAAQLRKTSTQVSTIKTALLTFRDKYQGLPGDLKNATAFWGAADGNDGLGTDCYTAQAATATCNGDGNGLLDQGPENYRMWQQLANAGLIAGSYSGVPGTPVYTNYTNDKIGINIPADTTNPNAGYAIVYWWANMTYANSGYTKPQNTMTIAPCCYVDAARSSIEGAAYMPEDMWNIDSKLDDGKPGSGFIQIYAGYGGCASSATDYNLTGTSIACQPLIGMGI